MLAMSYGRVEMQRLLEAKSLSFKGVTSVMRVTDGPSYPSLIGITVRKF